MTTQPVFSVKPILRFGTVLLVYIVLGAVVTCAALMLADVVSGLFASIPGTGLAAGAILWLMAIGAFTWKLLDNYAHIRYDFYPDRLEERGSVPSTVPYENLGHLSFDGRQTLMLYSAFEGTTPRRPLRIDVPEGLGGEYFKRMVELVKRADPRRLFSYAVGSDLHYSVPPDKMIDLDAACVQRLVLKPDEEGQRDITIDDSDSAAFTILAPTAAGKRARMPDDLLVVKHTRPGEIVRAPLLVMNPSDIGESNLMWQVYSIWNGEGVLIGRLRRQLLIPPAVHLEVELLDLKLTLDDSTGSGTLNVLRGDQPIGVLTQNPHPVEEIDTLVLDQPLGLMPALALLLALIRSHT